MKKRFTALITAAAMIMCLFVATSVYAVPPISLMADCTITGTPSVTWTGKPLKIEITVKYGSKTLKEGTDYIVEYDFPGNGLPGNYGTATAIGVGKYTDSLDHTFLILYKDVPISHRYEEHVYWASYNKYMTGYTGSRLGYFGVADNITRGQMVTALWRYAGKPKPKSNKQAFEDVPTTHSFYKAIQWASEEGITGGYKINGKKYFKPNDNCTRGQMVVFLWRFKGKTDPIHTEQRFDDVPKGHSFFNAVQWASEYEIASGFKDGTFGVNKTCTRGQCVTFLHRMYDAYYEPDEDEPEPEY